MGFTNDRAEPVVLDRDIANRTFLVHFSGIEQSSVRKKMAAVHLTTIPCEPNTAHVAHRMLCFCEIHPRTNNIVHAGFQGFRTFLCAFMSVFAVFAR